jgi:hypothetical protein
MIDTLIHPMPWRVEPVLLGYEVQDANGVMVAAVASRDAAYLIAVAPEVFRSARMLLTGLNAQSIAGLDVGFQNTRNQLQAEMDRGTIR